MRLSKAIQTSSTLVVLAAAIAIVSLAASATERHSDDADRINRVIEQRHIHGDWRGELRKRDRELPLHSTGTRRDTSREDTIYDPDEFDYEDRVLMDYLSTDEDE